MVELKVRKFGNSLGVVLPKEVTSRLGAKDGAPLFLTEAAEGGYRLTIRPSPARWNRPKTSLHAIATRCMFWRNERAGLARTARHPGIA